MGTPEQPEEQRLLVRGIVPEKTVITMSPQQILDAIDKLERTKPDQIGPDWSRQISDISKQITLNMHASNERLDKVLKNPQLAEADKLLQALGIFVEINKLNEGRDRLRAVPAFPINLPQVRPNKDLKQDQRMMI